MVMLYVALFLVGLLLLLLIFGYFSPAKFHIEESTLVNADLQTTFMQMADFENFVTWSPWSRKDPNMQQWFEGEKMSVGHKYIWQGNNKVGKGYMVITHIEANERIDIDLNFGPQGLAKCGFMLESNNNTTKVTWCFDTDMGNNPFKRLFGRIMAGLIRKDYAEGLSNLSAKFHSK